MVDCESNFPYCALRYCFRRHFPVCSNIQDVDAQMDSIREQMEVSNQISEAISSPHNLGIDIDEVSLMVYISKATKTGD